MRMALQPSVPRRTCDVNLIRHALAFDSHGITLSQTLDHVCGTCCLYIEPFIQLLEQYVCSLEGFPHLRMELVMQRTDTYCMVVYETCWAVTGLAHIRICYVFYLICFGYLDVLGQAFKLV